MYVLVIMGVEIWEKWDVSKLEEKDNAACDIITALQVAFSEKQLL